MKVERRGRKCVEYVSLSLKHLSRCFLKWSGGGKRLRNLFKGKEALGYIDSSHCNGSILIGMLAADGFIMGCDRDGRTFFSHKPFAEKARPKCPSFPAKSGYPVVYMSPISSTERIRF